MWGYPHVMVLVYIMGKSMDLQKINKLIEKYSEGIATESEITELNQWYRLVAYSDSEFPEDEELVREEMIKALNQKIGIVKTRKLPFRWLVAASIIVFLGISGLLVLRIIDSEKRDENQNIVNIAPGKNKAILTLANGKKVSLSDMENGQIPSQDGITITKAGNGQLIYKVENQDGPNQDVHHGAKEMFNTVQTPKGGQYQVLLPDGSRVWLNAFSSLKFPVYFNPGSERVVKLSGEAYFEVSHREKQPFKVVMARQTVEVLGTHFNINGYADDTLTKTTLLQGSVRISTLTKTATLEPGEQSSIGGGFAVKQVNAEESVAWKNGYFKFDDEKLDYIMKSISRWYDVEVIFQDPDLRNETFGAVTTRFANINALLRMIEQTGNAHFAIHGRTIIVSNKK
jgi:transmembrane sensor